MGWGTLSFLPRFWNTTVKLARLLTEGKVYNAARSSVEKSQGYRYTLPWLSQYLDHILRERNKEGLVQEYGQVRRQEIKEGLFTL